MFDRFFSRSPRLIVARGNDRKLYPFANAFRVMESVNPESQLNPCRWYHRCAVWPTKNLYPTYWKTVPPNAGIEAGKFLIVGVLDDATYWDRSSSNVKNLTKSCVKSHLKSVVTRVHE